MQQVNKPLTGKSVLIVEDEPLIAIMIEEMVDDYDCLARYTAASRDSALQFIVSGHVDLAVVDVNLSPHGSDFAVADALSERGIPFVFSSGHTVADLPVRHRHIPFLSKPFGNQELNAALNLICQ